LLADSVFWFPRPDPRPLLALDGMEPPIHRNFKQCHDPASMAGTKYTGSQMPTWIQIAGFCVAVIAPVATIVGIAIRITRILSRLEKRLENIELRIATVEFQNRALLKGFPQVIASLMAAHAVSHEQGAQMIATVLDSPPIADFLRQIKPTINPLSQADLDRFRNYVDRLRLGQLLNPDEVRDFYRISDIVTREYPGNESSWLIFLVGGILLGALLASTKK
jgi:hypothetical protein